MRAKHPALFMVDTISSLASIDYRHDEWGVDVTVAGSQKGLMLPPGLSFNAISREGAGGAQDGEAAAQLLGLGRDARQRQERLLSVHAGDQPALRPARGARACCSRRKGSTTVFARHERHAEATRRAVRAWGLEVLAPNPREYSSSLTAVLMPAGPRRRPRCARSILENFDMSLGTGLGKLAGKVFRIGHLGDFNDLTLMGTLAGVEMGLALAGVPLKKEGVQAAMDYLAERPQRREGRRRTQGRVTQYRRGVCMKLPKWAAVALVATAMRPSTSGASGARPIRRSPVRMVVGFPPGGGTDVVARVISQKLSEWYGQPVVVENRPGATGTIGADLVAKSAARRLHADHGARELARHRAQPVHQAALRPAQGFRRGRLRRLRAERARRASLGSGASR